MAKTKISEFDVDPANNTDINSINIAEGCAPSGINNAIRQLMSDLKEFQTGASGDPFTVGGAFAANGGATLGDASGDALTINSSAVSIPNGLNFGSNNLVLSSGNVGIGTSSPSFKLDVSGSAGNGIRYAANSVSSVFGESGSGAYIGTTTNHFAAFATNATERMRIDSSGNVGIGTSSPITKLGINGGTSILGGNKLFLWNTANNSAPYLRSPTDNTIAFFDTSDSERMRIDSSGNLLVGKTIDDEAVTGFRVSSGGTSEFTNTNSGTQYPLAFYRTGNANPVGSISTTTSATAYNTSSDYRLKENIAPMTGALAKVSALKPVTYKWKVDGSDGEGFIAHELQEVVPDCVTGEKDAVDGEGKPVYQGIDVSFLVATLTAALQEAHGLIKDLQARVEALESK